MRQANIFITKYFFHFHQNLSISQYKINVSFLYEDVRNLSVKQLKIPLDLANRSSVTEKDDESRAIINCIRRQSPICNFNHQLREGDSITKCSCCEFKIRTGRLTIVQTIKRVDVHTVTHERPTFDNIKMWANRWFGPIRPLHYYGEFNTKGAQRAMNFTTPKLIHIKRGLKRRGQIPWERLGTFFVLEANTLD